MNGIHEVTGSIPVWSTTLRILATGNYVRESSVLRHHFQTPNARRTATI